MFRLEKSDSASGLAINNERLQELKEALALIEHAFPNSPTPNQLDLLMTPGVVSGEGLNADELTAACRQAAASLVKNLVITRKDEGEKLSILIQDRCLSVSSIVAEYRAHRNFAMRKRQRVMDRIEGLNIAHDQERLEEELAFLASKSDVAEELDRLDAHLSAINEALSGKGPCGRRLDFLMQELNREANTSDQKQPRWSRPIPRLI